MPPPGERVESPAKYDVSDPPSALCLCLYYAPGSQTSSRQLGQA